MSIMELMRRETMETMVSMANMGSTVMDMGTKADGVGFVGLSVL